MNWVTGDDLERAGLIVLIALMLVNTFRGTPVTRAKRRKGKHRSG